MMLFEMIHATKKHLGIPHGNYLPGYRLHVTGFNTSGFDEYPDLDQQDFECLLAVLGTEALRVATQGVAWYQWDEDYR